MPHSFSTLQILLFLHWTVQSEERETPLVVFIFLPGIYQTQPQQTALHMLWPFYESVLVGP